MVWYDVCIEQSYTKIPYPNLKPSSRKIVPCTAYTHINTYIQCTYNMHTYIHTYIHTMYTYIHTSHLVLILHAQVGVDELVGEEEEAVGYRTVRAVQFG